MKKDTYGISYAFYAVMGYVLALLGQPLLCGLLLAFTIVLVKNKWAGKQVIQAFVLSLAAYLLQILQTGVAVVENVPLFGMLFSGMYSLIAAIVNLFIIIVCLVCIINAAQGKGSGVPGLKTFASWAYGEGDEDESDVAVKQYAAKAADVSMGAFKKAETAIHNAVHSEKADKAADADAAEHSENAVAAAASNVGAAVSDGFKSFTKWAHTQAEKFTSSADEAKDAEDEADEDAHAAAQTVKKAIAPVAQAPATVEAEVASAVEEAPTAEMAAEEAVEAGLYDIGGVNLAAPEAVESVLEATESAAENTTQVTDTVTEAAEEEKAAVAEAAATVKKAAAPKKTTTAAKKPAAKKPAAKSAAKKTAAKKPAAKKAPAKKAPAKKTPAAKA